MNYESCFRGESFACTDTKPRFLPDAVFDTLHVKLELAVDLHEQTIDGWCHSTVRILGDAVGKLTFQSVDQKIKSVLVRVGKNDKPVKTTWRADKLLLVVKLPWPLTAGAEALVSIQYRIEKPRAGMHFITPSREYPNRPFQAWTQGQSDDARCWFPCRDVPSEKATSEVVVTVANGLLAISNGVLVNETTDLEKKKTTFHWKMECPHSLSLLSLVVGEFEKIRVPCKKVPLLLYYPPGRKKDALRGFAATAPSMDFLIGETGVAYPYARYSQVAAYDFGGGMENTTATTQTDLALLDERAAIDLDFDGLVSHEMAHQWFGDLVTCKDWSHGWLNESFATYYEALFQKSYKGIDEFRFRCWSMCEDYFNECIRYRRPIMTRVWRESFQMFDRHLYQKGACVLHYLRSRVGEAAWRRGIKAYLEKHAFGAVETTDLQKAIAEVTGFNLEPEFEQWIYRPGHPEFKIIYGWEARKKEATLRIIQKQALDDGKAVFKLPVTVAFDLLRGRKTFSIELDEVEQAFTFKLGAEPANVVFDPESHILLKKIEWLKPQTMWECQLSDLNVLIRFEAVENISALGTPAAADLLVDHFSVEKFWWLRSRLVVAIGRIGLPSAVEALRGFLKDPNPKIRRAVVTALAPFRRGDLAGEFERIFRTDPSLFVAGEALKALAKTHDPSARGAIDNALKTDSWNEWIRVAAVEALAEMDGRAESLELFLQPGVSYQVKVAAIACLGRLQKGDPSILRKIWKFIEDPARAVPFGAIQALVIKGDPSVVPILRKFLDKERDSFLRGILDRAIRALRNGKADDPPGPKPA